MTNKLDEVKDFLAEYSPAVEEIALSLRNLILSVIPEAQETADRSGRVIGYGRGSGYKGLICTIILSKTGVKLGMVGGADLPDPKGLLEGAGKKHRYVQLQTVTDLKKPGLKQLLKEESRRKIVGSKQKAEGRTKGTRRSL